MYSQRDSRIYTLR